MVKVLTTKAVYITVPVSIKRNPETKLYSLARRFAEAMPHLAAKNEAFGNCKFTSYELAKFLRRNGIEADMYHMKGYRGSMFKDPHEKYKTRDPKQWSHYCVVVNNLVIDCTRRQFTDDCDFPHFDVKERYAKDWQRFHYDNFLNKFLHHAVRANL